MKPPKPWAPLVSPAGIPVLQCRLTPEAIEVSGGRDSDAPYVCFVPGQTITREEWTALSMCFQKAADLAADPYEEVRKLQVELQEARRRIADWERLERVRDLTTEMGRYKLSPSQKEGAPHVDGG